MHDGIELEARGIPTAVICTEPFISSGRAISRIKGIPNYQFVVTPHPLGTLSSDELRKIAIQSVPEVLRILLARD